MAFCDGEILGIYGASGSGKSTLLNLLLGFNEPDDGAILIDGTDLRSIDKTSHRRQVSVISQDPGLFLRSIRENLIDGLPSAPDKEIVTACHSAGIHDFITGLQRDYDTVIGERGAKLSGSQKQRVAVARALLRRPRHIVVDDLHNHLDETTTTAILNNIRNAGVSAIVASHDRSLSTYFDRAYEIIDSGSGVKTIKPLSTASEATPIVSVVMPAFNAEAYVAEAIRSVLAQTYAPIELVCVNDGSTDRTIEILRSFDDRIALVDCPINGGIGAARNAGLRKARGSAIAFMDADDLWEPNKLAVQMRRLDDPKIDLSFTHMRCFLSPELSDEVKAVRQCPADPVPGYLASSAVVRRTALELIGLFDPTLRVGEFVDWFARAKEAGLSFDLEEEALLHRRIHAANTGVTERRSYVDYVKVVRQALERKRRSS